MSDRIYWPDKDPDETVDYGFDWSAALGTDTISTSTWIVPAGITQNSASNTATSSTIWLSSGTAGAIYELTNRVVTAGGRTYDQTAVLLIKQN
jgi:hypothetical protein